MMTNNWKTCTSTAVVLTPILGPDRKVKVELFSTDSATVELIWMFLNGDRMEIEGKDRVPVKRLVRTVELGPYVGQQYCPEVERAISGIGGLPAYYGKDVVTIPESMRAMSSYSGLRLFPTYAGSAETSLQDMLYIERLNHDLAIGLDPVRCYGFLPTGQQREQQIEVIDKKMQLSDGNSDTCADGLVNAYFNVLGGYDTIYMADDLETRS